MQPVRSLKIQIRRGYCFVDRNGCQPQLFETLFLLQRSILLVDNSGKWSYRSVGTRLNAQLERIILAGLQPGGRFMADPHKPFLWNDTDLFKRILPISCS